MTCATAELAEARLSVKEAAALARVHPDTIRRWIRADMLACERLGPFGVIRIKPEALRQAACRAAETNTPL